MSLFILTETSAGYALLKAKDKKLLKRDDLASEAETAEGVSNLMKLKNFQKFDSAATALEEAAALVEGKVTPRLAKLLDSIKDEKKVSLAVADVKLGNAISKLPGLSIKPIADSSTLDLYRAIRAHLPTLIPGLMPADMATMSLGLSHSLARHKLKFSPDKIDTMIVQAIALLDDLDKELNTYAMRVKEWYGWHFPELAKILNDNIAYAKVVLKMGMRTNAHETDLADILPEEIEAAVKTAGDRSMGTEISNEDLENIQALAEEVVGFYEYRQQLANYLSARMAAIAPNLTSLVGDLVGARLIAHAGSLLNLSKSPASTIQILGAEKALFRALKTKHDTPKYGLIYHASLIGQATGKNKGKMARVLAAKAAIGIRVDALSDWPVDEDGNEPSEEEKAALGIASRYYLEKKLAAMEGKPLKPRGIAIAPNGVPVEQPNKWEINEARKYNPDADGLAGDEEAATAQPPKKSKKDKKKLIEEVKEAESDSDIEMEDEEAAVNGSKEDESSAESSSEDEKPKKSKKDKAPSVEELAAKAGLSVKRYQRKLERGEIEFDSEGNPSSISKKDVKKAKKEAKKAGKEEGKKRKRSQDEEEGETKSEKKKKKKSKEPIPNKRKKTPRESNKQILDPQSATLSNAEVLAHLTLSPPRRPPSTPANARNFIPSPDLRDHNTVVKEFHDYVTRLSPHILQYPSFTPPKEDSTTDGAAAAAAPPPTDLDFAIRQLITGLKPFGLTKAEVLMVMNLGVGIEVNQDDAAAAAAEGDAAGGDVDMADGNENHGSGEEQGEEQEQEQEEGEGEDGDYGALALLDTIIEDREERLSNEDVLGILRVVKDTLGRREVVR
ncbi:nucleolar protein 58 [Polytolypa hystricis UAMH7299]|uniref:Nucleolar protein 58 n=1 Tax=Polytolypa hystricis (strain UAMH7299) TaxID=1447883 RepID=A0A2B7XQL4_POLH7|nr:nucleolar protein 58 [Polytolypa hystricis UAMH7299]